jgi:hypothetical protein
MWYFRVWFSLLIIISLKVICFWKDRISYFCGWIKFHSFSTFTYPFIHSCVLRMILHLGYHGRKHGCENMLISFLGDTQNRITCSLVVIIFNILWNLHHVFHNNYTDLYSHEQCASSPFFQILNTICYLFLCIYLYLTFHMDI